jgi:hypothetical protein
MRRKNKSENFTPKIEPLQGGILAQFKRCGRSNCRCAAGSLHGPYYYRVWMAQGTRYKTYVKKADLERISAGIEAFQAQKREQQQSRAEIKNLLRENRETRRNLYAILRSGGSSYDRRNQAVAR